jgi:hypothetical protein
MRKDTRNNSIRDEATAAISAAHILYPGMHFDHPRDVLAAEQIAKDEKRAILASWASDICAIDSLPSLRRFPGMDHAVTYDDILDALKTLDKEAQPVNAGIPSFSADAAGPNCRRRRGIQLLRKSLAICRPRKNVRQRQPFEI